MKNYTAESIRNVGVFGHAGEGKTTLVEAILFDTGLVDRIGKVENGTTVSDFDPEEAKPRSTLSTPRAATTSMATWPPPRSWPTAP